MINCIIVVFLTIGDISWNDNYMSLNNHCISLDNYYKPL